MNKIKAISLKILKILFLLFLVLIVVGYFNNTSKQKETNTLAQKYKQQIIQNGWSNDTIAFTWAAILVDLEHTNRRDCSENTQCYKNVKSCSSAIFVNTKFTSDHETFKLTSSNAFKKCLKSGDSNIFFEFLELKYK